MLEQRMIIEELISSQKNMGPFTFKLKGENHTQSDFTTGGKLILGKEDLERFDIYKFTPFDLIDKILVCSFEEVYLHRNRDLENYDTRNLVEIRSLSKIIKTAEDPNVGRYWFSIFYYFELSSRRSNPRYSFEFAIDQETYEKYERSIIYKGSQTCFLVELKLINRFEGSKQIT